MVATEMCNAMHGIGTTAFLHDKKLDIAEQVEQALEFFKKRRQDGLAGKGRGSFAMLQGYYCRDILEWVFSKGLSKKTWDRADNVTKSRVWMLLGLVLSDEEIVARGFVFPAVITTGMVQSISGGVEAAKQGRMDEYSAVLEHMGTVVELLNTKYEKEFVLHLEHAATLLESCMKLFEEWNGEKMRGVLESVSSLYIVQMDRYVHEKKVWEAIVVRHLRMMCVIGFGEETCGALLRNNVERILSHAMFSRESLVGLSQMLLENEGGSDQGHYARKLFTLIRDMVMNAIKHGDDDRLWRALEGFFPWLVQSFIQEMEYLHMERKSSDIALFNRCAHLVMRKTRDESVKKHCLVCLSALVSRMPALGIYRPTEQASGPLLKSMVDAIVVFAFDAGFDSQNEPDVVSLCVEILAGIVVVEHRPVEERLDDLWSLINAGCSQKTRVSASLSIIIKEYSALRRLDVLLDSCFAAISCHTKNSVSRVLHEGIVVESIQKSMGTIPSGQSLTMIHMLQRRLSNRNSGDSLSLASLTCLILNALPLDLTNAEKMANSLQELLCSIFEGLNESIARSDPDMISSLLTVHVVVTDLHAQCCRRDPNIKYLWGQDPHPDFQSYESMFNADTHVLELYTSCEDDTQHHSLQLDEVMKLFTSLEGASFSRLAYSLVLSIRMCMKVLSEVRLYFLHRVCSGPESDGKIENDIQVLLDISRQIFQEVESRAEGYGEIENTLLYHLNQQNALGELLKLFDADSQWVQTALKFAEPDTRMYFIQVILSHQASKSTPSRTFWNMHGGILVQASRNKVLDMTRYVEKKVSKIIRKTKKRKIDDNAFEMLSILLRLPKITMDWDTANNSVNLLEGALAWMLEHSSDHGGMPYLIKGQKLADIVLDGYTELALLCQSDHVEMDVLQSIQSLCISHLFYGAMVLCSTTEITTQSNMKSHMMRIMRDLTKTLQMHSGLSLNINSCPANILHLFLQWVEISIKRQETEHNQTILVTHQIMVNDLFYSRSLAGMLEISQLIESTLTQTDLGIMQGFARASQEVPIDIRSQEKFKNAVRTLAQHIENTAEMKLSLLSAVASSTGHILEAAMTSQDNSIRELIFPLAPNLFKRCSRACTRALTAFQESQSACLLQIVAFMKAFSRLTGCSKPRASWQGYSNLLSVLLTNLVQCPACVGQGYMSRPNAPKEASLAVAASDLESSVGKIRRELLKSIAILFNSSTRSECTFVFEAIRATMNDESRFTKGCGLYPLEILLLLLEDSGNGVLKELLHHQVDKIIVMLIQDQNRYITQGHNGAGSIQISSLELFGAIQHSFLKEGGGAPPRAAQKSIKDNETILEISESTQLQFATNMRCLESVLCRPRIFKKVPKRLIPSVISQVQCTVECQMLRKPETCTGKEFDATFSNACHLLIGIMRHQPDVLTRTMHIMSSAIGSLQHTLAGRFIYIQLKGEKELAHPPPHLMESFSRVLEEFGKTRAAHQYCSDFIISHVKFFSCPLTIGSLQQIATKMQCRKMIAKASSTPGLPQKKTPITGTICVPTELQNLLTPGVCALFGACTTEDVQSIYAALGHGHDGSSVWRSALSNLKLVYEKHFKYIGKV